MYVYTHIYIVYTYKNYYKKNYDPECIENRE